MAWSTVSNFPANIDTMLLLTDGSIMCHVLASSNWYRLIPDKSGSYTNGNWVQTASMLNDSNLTATIERSNLRTSFLRLRCAAGRDCPRHGRRIQRQLHLNLACG